MEIRQASAADERMIKRMVREARINPFQLDWRRFLLVVDPAGQVVACAQVKSHGDGSRELASLVVVKAHRGEGLARLLIERLKQEHGAPLYLTCRAELQPFYRKFGFFTQALEDLPRYFHRISALVNLLSRWAGRPNRMAVMLWDGRS